MKGFLIDSNPFLVIELPRLILRKIEEVQRDLRINPGRCAVDILKKSTSLSNFLEY